MKIATLGPVRAKLIKKGMIYSPAHGDMAFQLSRAPLKLRYGSTHKLVEKRDSESYRTFTLLNYNIAQ